MTYLLCDIGGTKTRVGVSTDHETLVGVESFKTPAKPQDAIEKIAAAAKKISTEKPDAIAIGLRGLLNVEKTGIENDAVLTKWVGVDFAKLIEKQFKVTPRIENDTALVGLGEAVFGAGKGGEIVAYHSVSTGVGGVKIENGTIDQSSQGFEPGHQILDIDRTILGEEITPTLENLISGTAVEERFGTKPYEIPQDDVVWSELAEYLAQGLRNTILYWSPDIIVLGGAMMVGEPNIPLELVRKNTVEVLDDYVLCPLIVTAKFKDEGGLYGGIALLNTTQE